MKQEQDHNHDDLLRQAIQKRLEDEPKLDETKILLEVKDGEVHLKGKADTEEEKQMAEQIASTTPGVTKVINHLHVEIGIIHTLTKIAAQISENEDDKKK